jgi:GNAT superfamily N-acetyltransferase
MSKSEIEIVQTTLDRILDLRHAILRTGLPREQAIFRGDELATTLHVAAVRGSDVVGCASFHLNHWQDAAAYQLRGMATAESARRQGVGRQMLSYAEAELLSRGQTRQLWCNARVPAIPFYEAMGWTVESGVIEIPTAGPHVKMAKSL